MAAAIAGSRNAGHVVRGPEWRQHGRFEYVWPLLIAISNRYSDDRGGELTDDEGLRIGSGRS